MTDPFIQPLEELMSRITETTPDDAPSAAEQVRQNLSGRQVCPFCGHQYSGGADPCPHCLMEDTPATRQATKARIGPWYVLQARNPSAPGMKFATLVALINRGHVTLRSVVRGPTTHQLWRFAAHVRGVSREFGLCYSCGGSIDRTSSLCPHCQRSQQPPPDPDVLLESRATIAGVPLDNGSAGQRRDAGRGRSPSPDSVAGRLAGDRARRSDGRVVCAMELAAALRDDPAKALRPPKRRFMKAAVLLLMIAAVAVGGVIYLLPQYRQPTMDWVNRTWAAIKARASSIDWSTDTSSPQIQTAPAAAQSPKPAEPATAHRENAGVAKLPEAKPEGSQRRASEPPTDLTAAIERARTLWGRAIDAEARRDFASAVGLYEQIRTLPPDAWPAGLQLRLDDARKRSGSTRAD